MEKNHLHRSNIGFFERQELREPMVKFIMNSKNKVQELIFASDAIQSCFPLMKNLIPDVVGRLSSILLRLKMLKPRLIIFWVTQELKFCVRFAMDI